jgi:anti-anti-sigma factor
MSTTYSAPPDGGRMIVTIEEVDRSTYQRFVDELTAGIEIYLADGSAAGRERLRPLVVDLGRVTFLDSSGVRALVDADRLARAGGGRLHLHAAAPCVEKVLELTGVWDRLHGYVVR